MLESALPVPPQLRDMLQNLDAALGDARSFAAGLIERLKRQAAAADSFVEQMDFSLLFDGKRKLKVSTLADGNLEGVASSFLGNEFVTWRDGARMPVVTLKRNGGTVAVVSAGLNATNHFIDRNDNAAWREQREQPGQQLLMARHPLDGGIRINQVGGGGASFGRPARNIGQLEAGLGQGLARRGQHGLGIVHAQHLGRRAVRLELYDAASSSEKAAQHAAALRQHGPLQGVHRFSFKPVYSSKS